MYFDAVLDKDSRPIFNGTPEETMEWLKTNQWAHKVDVCIGRTMQIVSVPEYLEQI